MNLFYCSLVFMFISGLFVFCFVHKHLLLTLFSLEYMVLLLYLVIYYYLLELGSDMYFILVFLVFSVCEGSLGLGVLVNMIRSHGNDYLSSLSVLSW
uniref:NADH-ubiquinone oxidoreductase chain 4L n=2 Tax=Physopelta TaxID=209985 RepID=B7SML4_9HEMI|nr:NADH dehydrogenase subunit 4L [Physopelta gutta]YP_009643424.1 NADH dehydrogenase subunit 4L [Physopelta cincticollis]ABZ02108.1 NADH dehydrogenase subunit 4L [Physopelta gutta]APO08854.1 NADH dehydrogenase subunit 4L [Physopelta cincticollis]